MYVWSIIGVAVFYLAQNAVVSASIKEKEGGIVYQPRHLLRASVIARQKAVSIDEGKAPLPPGFKYIYVTNNGSLVNSSGAPGDTIEVSGSPKTQMRSVRMAASTVARMVKKMPQAIFRRISRDAGVGVFTAEEKIIIYPSFADLKNGDCGTNCTGDCEKTCTFDGRKYEDIGAAAGERAAIEEDSVMCGVTFNTFELIDVVSHEFGHTAMMYGMSDTQYMDVLDAYDHAKKQKIWNLQSYAMANEDEYFATAATVFFGVNLDTQDNTGGMNLCGNDYCKTESESRGHLKLKDNKLYQILVEVFTDNHANYTSGMMICPPTSL